MHLTALNKDGKVVHIDEITDHGVFYDRTFPESEMIAVLGEIKQHHFRYKPGTQDRDTWADDNNSMCEWHIEHQNLFPKECQEVPIKNHRADVLLGSGNNSVAIEFQHSYLSAIEIAERSDFYVKNAGSLVWVIDYTDVNIECIGNHTFRTDSRKIIGGLKLQPFIEIFLHAKNGKYVHISEINDSWKSFVGYELDREYFIRFVHLVKERASGITFTWDERNKIIEKLDSSIKLIDQNIDKTQVLARKLNEFESFYMDIVSKRNDEIQETKEEIENQFYRMQELLADSWKTICVSLAWQAVDIIFESLSKNQSDKSIGALADLLIEMSNRKAAG